MKLLLLLMTLLLLALAANSFAGANIYYLYALPTANCIAILNGMQAAGMKVLHTWATGIGAGQKASNNISVCDLEVNGIGNYDDTVMNLIDQLVMRPLSAPLCS
ncbi:hypothetical protein B0H14DRAFT_2556780 [Mycena olivaceomarginata]|nr:hypothetical protein B0H14DRAFT_2556780 [Mycena olivaceomarginata]